MQSDPKERDAALLGLLAELNDRYDELQAGCRTVRAALVRHDNAAVLSGVKELQQVIARARGAERRMTTALREHGLLGSSESFTLMRLSRHPFVRDHPELAARLAGAATSAAGAAREAALNRRLIERLSGWLQREVRSLLAPFMEPVGYGAGGRRREAASRPALIDRRG